MMAPDQSKYFEYAREISRYAEREPDSDLAKANIVPQYILVGDQSSGKTSILCRLAGLPLGFTTNGTGTRRPFEYTFIHEETCVKPRITVDSKKVAEDALLQVMANKNGSSGFTTRSVSVKIEWKDIAMDMIIVDMPGMKDGEDKPEQMLLEKLAINPGATPVVVLEPRDMGSAHYIFKVLQRAKPQRSISAIIALVNKCDMQMSGNGEWMSTSSWEEWWRGAQGKGFMHLFCVGWPGCTDRSSSDPDVQKENLIKSVDNEEELIEGFTRRVPPSGEARDFMGLRKFQECLHCYQLRKMHEFVQKSSLKLEAEARRLERLNEEMDHDPAHTLRGKQLSLINSWCAEGIQLLEGRFDPHFQVDKTTLMDDLTWLQEQENMRRFNELPLFHQHGKVAQEHAKDMQTIKVLDAMHDSSMSFIGKAALERDVQLIFVWGFVRVFKQKMMDFTEEFVKNIHSRSQEDTGNMVIKEFTARVMAQTLHPLVDVLCLLVWRHVEVALMATFSGMEEEGREWKQLFETFQHSDLLAEFQQQVQHFTKALSSDLNKDLHERLDDQAGGFQGAYRSSARSRTLATNTAGIRGLDAHEQVHDQAVKRRRPAGNAQGCVEGCLQLFMEYLGGPRPPWGSEFHVVAVSESSGPESTPSSSQPATVDAKEEFRSQARRFLSLASQELAHTGKEGEEVARFADYLHIGLGLMQGSYSGKAQLQEVFTLHHGSACWNDKANALALSPSESDPASLVRSMPFGITSSTEVNIVIDKPADGPSVTVDLADKHADISTLPRSFAGVAIRNVLSDTWLASACVSEEGKNTLTLTLSRSQLRKLVGVVVVLELLVTRGARLSVVSLEVKNSPSGMQEAPMPQARTSDASSSARAAPPHASDGGSHEIVLLGGQHFQAIVPLYQTMRQAYHVPRERQTRGMDLQKLHNDASYELIWQLVEFRKVIDQRVSCMRKSAIKRFRIHMIQHISHGCIEAPLKQQRTQKKRLGKSIEVLQRAKLIRQDLIGKEDDSDEE